MTVIKRTPDVYPCTNDMARRNWIMMSFLLLTKNIETYGGGTWLRQVLNNVSRFRRRRAAGTVYSYWLELVIRKQEPCTFSCLISQPPPSLPRLPARRACASIGSRMVLHDRHKLHNALRYKQHARPRAHNMCDRCLDVMHTIYRSVYTELEISVYSVCKPQLHNRMDRTTHFRYP